MSNELYHYGVPGMKWGKRRALRREAKAQYRKRTDDAFKEYEKTIADIEKPYKRFQNLSKKDVARQEAAEKKYADTVAKAKADYKAAKKSIRQNSDRGKKYLTTHADRMMSKKVSSVSVDRKKMIDDLLFPTKKHQTGTFSEKATPLNKRGNI